MFKNRSGKHRHRFHVAFYNHGAFGMQKPDLIDPAFLCFDKEEGSEE